jgi:hypothetical protein
VRDFVGENLSDLVCDSLAENVCDSVGDRMCDSVGDRVYEFGSDLVINIQVKECGNSYEPFCQSLKLESISSCFYSGSDQEESIGIK